jgi:hypothetical protein
MGILDQIIQMRGQGMSDQDIASHLEEQGIYPKAINDALNQANIKNAVGNTGMEDIEAPQAEYNDENAPIPQNEHGYQQSTEEGAEDVYTPRPERAQPSQYVSNQSYQEIYPQEQNYAETDADTMVEIAQQVFSEKIKKIQQQLEDLNEFKTIYQAKTDGIFERLKRIESIIDRLQSAILEKVGAYGSGIESVKKELSMMQGAYGKILASATEHHHTQQSHPAHHTPTEHAVTPAARHPSPSAEQTHSAPIQHPVTHHPIAHSANPSGKHHGVTHKSAAKTKKRSKKK